MNYPAYQFHSLQKYSREEVQTLNHVFRYLVPADLLKEIFKAIAETLFTYDISGTRQPEIQLQVRAITDPSGVKHRFVESKITIGRVSENNLILKSPLVSKKHAEIFRRGTGYFLKDLNSNNGTILNQVQIQGGTDVPIKNEDVIKIEPFEITVGYALDTPHMPLEVSLTDVSIVSTEDVSKNVFIHFERLPAGKPGVVSLSQEAARWMVQKTLAGREPYSHFWTEIEAGIMEYLASRVLSMINPFLKDERLVLRNVDVNPAIVATWLSGAQKAVRLTFSGVTELGTLHCAVLLPAELTDRIATPNIEPFVAAIPWIRQRAYIFAVQVGETLLNPHQLSALESGDILLLDRTEIHLQDKMPQGKIRFRSHQLKRGFIRGSLICDRNGSAGITIEEIIQEGLTPMTESSKKKEAAPEGSAAGIVAGLELPVSIEFARLSFTLEELAAVKEGQIIELEKSQPEMVDLSVDGKIIGNGKLVDVEGKLGVRVLKVIKAKA